MRLNHLLAGSLMVVMVGTLSACSSTGNRTTSETQRTTQEGVNQPVNYQATADQNANMTPEENKNALKNLQTGQPLSYYNNEFNHLGFSVAHSTTMNDQHTYDLRKGDERYMVTLSKPDDQDRVNKVDVRELRSLTSTTSITTATNENTDNNNNQNNNQANTHKTNDQDKQEVSATTKEIESLQTGKKLHEYISTIDSKYGNVTEYSSNKDNAEIEFENSKKHYYQVNFKLDPNTQKVTDIKVNRNVWQSL
jgi:hypothetical protein